VPAVAPAGALPAAVVSANPVSASAVPAATAGVGTVAFAGAVAATPATTAARTPATTLDLPVLLAGGDGGRRRRSGSATFGVLRGGGVVLGALVRGDQQRGREPPLVEHLAGLALLIAKDPAAPREGVEDVDHVVHRDGHFFVLPLHRTERFQHPAWHPRWLLRLHGRHRLLGGGLWRGPAAHRPRLRGRRRGAPGRAGVGGGGGAAARRRRVLRHRRLRRSWRCACSLLTSSRAHGPLAVVRHGRDRHARLEDTAVVARLLRKGGLFAAERGVPLLLAAVRDEAVHPAHARLQRGLARGVLHRRLRPLRRCRRLRTTLRGLSSQLLLLLQLQLLLLLLRLRLLQLWLRLLLLDLLLLLLLLQSLLLLRLLQRLLLLLQRLLLLLQRLLLQSLLLLRLLLQLLQRLLLLLLILLLLQLLKLLRLLLLLLLLQVLLLLLHLLLLKVLLLL